MDPQPPISPVCVSDSTPDATDPLSSLSALLSREVDGKLGCQGATDLVLPISALPSIYVAGPISAKGDVREVVAEIRSLRIANVVSRWHDLPDALTDADPKDPKVRRKLNDMNMQDIDKSDLSVVWTLTGQPCTTYSEIGYALGTKKRVLWVQGPAHVGANIFDSHPLTTILTHLRAPIGDVPIAHPKTAAWAVWRYFMDEVEGQCDMEHPSGVMCQRPRGHYDGVYHDDHIGHGWRWSGDVLRSTSPHAVRVLYAPNTPDALTWQAGQFGADCHVYRLQLTRVGIQIYGGLR